MFEEFRSLIFSSTIKLISRIERFCFFSIFKLLFLLVLCFSQQHESFKYIEGILSKLNNLIILLD